MKTFRVDPGIPRDQVPVTQVRVQEGGSHDRVSVWNRGGLAGTLTVESGDGMPMARAIMDAYTYTFNEVR